MERNRKTVEKFDIKLKSKPKDGVILQLHHTVRGSKGECRRIRFSTGGFDDAHEKLACVDSVGNLFILDFVDLKFWKHTNFGPCTAVHFVPHKFDTLILANSNSFNIMFIDIETGEKSLTLVGHTAPVKHISFSNSKIPNLLTSSSTEAILWELQNYTKYFTLNTYLGAMIQQIMFTPGGDYLVACFQNDTIQIWKHDSMKSVKQIIPNQLNRLKSIAFTMNGRAMAMAGLSPNLILFNMDTWKSIKLINMTKYKISSVQHVAFIPQVFDGGANKILAILSNDCILHLLNVESLCVVHSIRPESSNIRKFVISPTGKYFFCILQLGEVNIYNSSYVMNFVQDTQSESTMDAQGGSAYSYVVKEDSLSRTKIEQKMKVCMDSSRLRRILMQYGEYPDKFRSIIWQSLLNAPKNKTAYLALVDKGIHPSYKDVEKQFTIHSTITLKNLRRLLSCLAHWSPLFGVMKFLPGFVFPFVKVLQKDPLLLFECVATVLLNQCQLWFEYAPFPPISILAIIENILAEHDQQLLDYYVKVGVTSQTYALKILETAFSEVLTCSEWLILWDHILSNEPAFIVMSVVSYNIVQRNAIKKLKTHEQIDNFFHMQNPVDKKTFLKKTYVLLNETPEEIHPRRFLDSFVPLDKGDCYQQFNGYPKATICLKLAKKERKKSTRKKTLKELIQETQEKVIHEMSTAETTSLQSVEEDIYDEDNLIQDAQTQNKEMCNRKKVKQEFINNIMYPKNRALDKKHQLNPKSTCISNRADEKKKQSSKKENLEKEIIKLIKNFTNSDMSDM